MNIEYPTQEPYYSLKPRPSLEASPEPIRVPKVVPDIHEYRMRLRHLAPPISEFEFIEFTAEP